MKKLLLAAALMVPLFVVLYSCSPTKTPEAPTKVPETVRVIPLDDFADRFPAPASAEAAPVAPAVTKVAPVVKKRRVILPNARPVIPAPIVEYETVPARVYLPCLFPLNLIPNCTPGGINPE